ncbi:unnamed protein product [Prunus armeniaca]|uniref:Uncharacterized protein n=1 Tax=Prunus armeniaca TaxID=36596 RepID=A0A6J5X8F6_PRUAR|nr:unnamed protein product [Prunus armeniaca]
MDACIFEEPSVYEEWTRAKIIREFYVPKPPTRMPRIRRLATIARQQHDESEIERVSHEAGEEGSFHISQPRFGKMTSDHIGANGQYERNRTLEVSSVCQATQEPRHAHQLYPRQAAQNENLGDGNTIILEELNVETGFSWPHNRVNPRSDGKELEWDEGHMTRGNTLITNWTRASPKERSSRLDLGPIGYHVQVEPYIPNPFGPKINLASTRIISHVDTTFHSMGLKWNPEMEKTCNLESIGKK